MKGHPESKNMISCSGGGVIGGLMMRKKRAAVMTVVVLVFAAAVMVVMGVHRLRERRVYHLLIKDKDRQIFSLQLLLQKEMQSSKESKRKNQDLNTKLFSLRNEKMELHNKILEMRSTISSLKDEMRALEVTLDEKLKEVKQKEAQIKDLRGNLGIPLKVWSVSADDPADPEVNLTNKVKVVQKEGSEVGASMERSLGFAQSTINEQKSKAEEGKAINTEENSHQSNTEVEKASSEDENGDRHLGQLESSEEHESKDHSFNVETQSSIGGRKAYRIDEDFFSARKTKVQSIGDHGVHKDNGTSDEDGVILRARGSRFIIGGSESRRNKNQELQGPGGSEGGSDKQIFSAHKENKEGEKGNASQQKISADVKPGKAEISEEVDQTTNNDEDSNPDVDRIDEDDADEADEEDEDIHGSNANSHGSEADQDYKEDMEE